MCNDGTGGLSLKVTFSTYVRGAVKYKPDFFFLGSHTNPSKLAQWDIVGWDVGRGYMLQLPRLSRCSGQ
jgi:hypothetical protein